MKGDYTPGKVIYLRFNTHKADGTPITLGGTPAISVYKQNSTSESTSGVTLTTDYDSRTGLHQVAIDTSADGTFYSAGSDFDVVITTGTVDSISVVGTVVGSFSLSNRSFLRPTTADRTLDVSAGGEAGVDWANVGSPTTTVNLSATTISTSQAVNTTHWAGTAVGSATVRSDVINIAGAAVNTSSAQLGVNIVNAAGTAWGSGAITAASIAASALNGKGDWNVGKTGYSLTAITGLGNQTADITGNLSGSVGSVTGSVGSVASGVTVATNNDKTGYSLTQAFPANFAVLAISATTGKVTVGTNDDKTGYSLTAGTITSIQSGLATSSALTTVEGKIDTIDGIVDAILVDTAEIGAAGAGLIAVPWNAAWDSEVESEVADALGVYDPPTKAELDSAVSPLALQATLSTVAGYVDTEVAAIKAKTDNLPSDPADASDITSAFSTVNSTLAVIAGYIDTEVAAIKAKTDNLPPSPAATSDIPSASTIASQVRTELTTELGRIDVAVGSRLPTSNYVAPANATIAAIEADTQDIQSRLPAALVSGRMDSNAAVVSDKTGYSLSGTLTTLDAFNTSLNTAHGSGSWATATGFSTLDGAGVRTAVGLASANLDSQLSTIDTVVDAVKAKTDNLPTSPAAVGSAMTLADGAITDAKFTFPAESAGRPTTFMAWIRRIGEWAINKRSRNQTTGSVVLYGADNTTVLETQIQSQSESAGVTTDTISKGV